jgi:hypothetical protein
VILPNCRDGAVFSQHVVGNHGQLHDRIEHLLIEAERTRVNELFRNGKLTDEARRRIERELDLREAHLANQIFDQETPRR